MNHHQTFTPTQNAPYLLSQDDLNNPMRVVETFFQNRHLAEHRQTLWDVLCAATTSDLAGLNDSREIGSWVMYFRMLEELIEAVWLINEKREK